MPSIAPHHIIDWEAAVDKPSTSHSAPPPPPPIHKPSFPSKPQPEPRDSGHGRAPRVRLTPKKPNLALPSLRMTDIDVDEELSPKLSNKRPVEPSTAAYMSDDLRTFEDICLSSFKWLMP
ncbi:hypothetical protein ACLB2K_059212 [Fragaria x ananassa]